MAQQTLAPVYMNNERVRLQGDPKPQVEKVVRASGWTEPKRAQVYHLEKKEDPQGTPLSLEDIIDRTEQNAQIWLRCVEKPSEPTTGIAMGGPTPSEPTGYHPGSKEGEFGPGPADAGGPDPGHPEPPNPPGPSRQQGSFNPKGPETRNVPRPYPEGNPPGPGRRSTEPENPGEKSKRMPAPVETEKK